VDVERQLGIRERPEGVVGSTRLKAVGPTRSTVRYSRSSSRGGTIGSSVGGGRRIGFHGGRRVVAEGDGLLVKGDGERGGESGERGDRGAGRPGNVRRARLQERRESRRPPGARRRRSVVLRCDGFQSAAELRGRLPVACPEGLGRRAPRPIGRSRSLGAGRFLLRPPSVAGMGWLGTTGQRERPECGAPGLAKASSSRRHGPRRPVRSVRRTAVFWERTRASRSVFPEGALGSEKLKTHFRVEVGFGCVR